MGRKFSLITGCKVNLNLRILDRQSNGLHLIDSLFYPLPRPTDAMDIIETSGSGLTVRCCPPELENRQNILHKAFDLFSAATGFRPGLRVFLHKNVPVGAGLGGGSSNAAAMLLALNTMADTDRLEHEELLSLAGRAGSDVPFFILNKPARVTGIGDILSALQIDLSGLSMVLICPGVHVDTAWAYRQWDIATENPAVPVPNSLTSPPSTDKGSPLEQLPILSNSFEQVIFSFYPDLGKIKTSMLENGAAACVMSGSGSSLTALFRDQSRACRACALLDRRSIQYYYFSL